VTQANVLRTATPPYTFPLPATVTTAVRDNLVSGDIWDNTSGSGLWSDAANWADNSEPTVASNVTFPVVFPNGDTHITLSAAENAAGLTLNDNYTLSGGSLALPAGAAIAVAATKSATVTSTLQAITWTKSGEGILTVPNVQADALTIGAGALKITPNGTPAGTSVVDSLTITGGVTPTARLDLTNNAAIIDFPMGGPNPEATVRAQILAGRGGSGLNKPWNGQGITSSQAAVDPLNAGSVGYAVNGTMPLGARVTFRGQPVDPTSVLMVYTRTGDANLDGVVNNDDVAVLGANYAPGLPKPRWDLGDFDYNGFVDNDDITLLGAFYNQDAPPIPAPAAAPASLAAVPEPATVILFASGLLLACAVRRFSRRIDASPAAFSHPAA
jgi:hypothetical protein